MSLLAQLTSGTAPIAHTPPPSSVRRHTADVADETLSGLDEAVFEQVCDRPGELNSDQLHLRTKDFSESKAHTIRSISKLMRLGMIELVDPPEVPPGERRYGPADPDNAGASAHRPPEESPRERALDHTVTEIRRRTMATTPKVVPAASLRAPAADPASLDVAALRGDVEEDVPESDDEAGAQAGLSAPCDLDADLDDDALDAGAKEAAFTTDEEEPAGPVLGVTREGYLEIDLPVLLRTRLLVTAASGGGKSFGLRRVLEQTAPLVQQIVLDPEGEFNTLAEQFPFAVFSDREDSKVRLSKCSPYNLAQELVKKGISAVIDMSDFEMDEQQYFVDRFIKGLMRLDKQYWHHVMVLLDEGHLFAPQQERCDSKKAVIDLACRGRKRGYCPIIATNRLSMLNKSVAAPLQNRLIGQTGLDTDVKRAADELGMSRPHAARLLSNLNPGDFMVYGPALSRTVRRVTIGPVKTTHGVHLGEIKGPVAPTESLVSEILANSEIKEQKQAAATGVGAGNAPQPPAPQQNEGLGRDALRAQVAAARLQILQPILAVGDAGAEGRGQAVTAAAEAAGLSTATLYLWLSKYDPANPVGSLMPDRVPRHARAAAATPHPAIAPPAPGAVPKRAKTVVKAKAHKPVAPKRVPRKKPVHLKAEPTVFSRSQRLKLSNARLTKRQLAVLEGLYGGSTVAALAKDMQLTSTEVRAQRQKALIRLGVPNMTQLGRELNEGRFADPAPRRTR